MKSRLFLMMELMAMATIFAEAQTVTIHIHDQTEMDCIEKSLYKALDVGYDEVIVSFDTGFFYYSDRQLLLDGLRFPETNLRFIGHGTTLTAKGEDYNYGDIISSPIEARSGVVSPEGDIFPWSNIYQADAKVQIIDKDLRTCRLRCKSLKKDQFGDITSCYILLTEWYLSKIFKVLDIEDGCIYFTADEDLDFLNADFLYAREFPRFKLTNSKDLCFFVDDGRSILSSPLLTVHICRAGRLLSAYDASFKTISFEGFRFLGNQDNVFALLDFTSTSTEGISISQCEFCGIRSKIIQVAYSPFFSFTNNYIHDCYRSGVISLYSSKTTVTNNIFQNVGLSVSNDFCIQCAGEDFLIANNLISDFGYGGISIGLHYTKEKTCPITGTVRNNELWYTPEYFASYKSHTLMDSGAIYITTQNDRVMIRDNYVHDYIGIRDNRGIFMDDGASNVIVINNTIKRTPHGWSIDSRMVKEIETMPESKAHQVNVGNLIHDNNVDGRIRFEKR